MSADDPQSLVGYGHYYCAYIAHKLDDGIAIGRREQQGSPAHLAARLGQSL